MADSSGSGYIYLPEGSWGEEKKKAFLAQAKHEAVGMLKTAGFYQSMQQPYPTSFLNLSDIELPRSQIQVFRWARYFFKLDPIVQAAIGKLSGFPVTDVLFDSGSVEDENDAQDDRLEALRKAYEKVFVRNLQIRRLLIEIGLDYWLYGNCFVMGDFVQTDDQAQRVWRRFVRLDPSRVQIDVDPLTQDRAYKYDIPEITKKIVRDKKPRAVFDRIPEIIKKAVRENKFVVLSNRNIFHFSRPSESGEGSVWGTPTVLPVMKLLMYRNMLRQAQEAIAHEHIVPLRIYFLEPQADQTTNPFAQWNTVANDLAEQLKAAANDPNYKLVSPLPVGVLNLGGDARALLITPEVEQVQEELLAGMGVPREFIFGGMSWTGSSVSLRILENDFITYRLLLGDFLDFAVHRMAEERGDWVPGEPDDHLPKPRLSDLKMQDDVQLKQILVDMNAQGKIPDEVVYEAFDLDPKSMREQLLSEAKQQFEDQAELQYYQAHITQQLQQRMEAEGLIPDPVTTDTAADQIAGVQPGPGGAPGGGPAPQGGPGGGPGPRGPGRGHAPGAVGAAASVPPGNPARRFRDADAEAQKIAGALARQPEDIQHQGLAQIKDVRLRNLVMHYLQQARTEQRRQDRANVRRMPMPEKLPPRRQGVAGH